MATPEKAFKLLTESLKLMAEDVIKESFTRIKRRTPVDTGAAKANWEVDTRQLEISNDLDYVDELELGKSNQAPAGMLRVTATEAEQMTKDSLSKRLK